MKGLPTINKPLDTSLELLDYFFEGFLKGVIPPIGPFGFTSFQAG
jgi:hypothetical protein